MLAASVRIEVRGAVEDVVIGNSVVERADMGIHIEPSAQGVVLHGNDLRDIGEPVPDPDRKRKRTILKGDVPSPLNPPSGCRFHPRCPIAQENCGVDTPQLRELRPDHLVACHYAEQFL